MRLTRADLRDKKYTKALNRVVLRLFPTREAFELKDNVLFLLAVAGQMPLNVPSPDQGVVGFSDAIHLAFQIAYNEPDIAFHALQAIFFPLAPAPVSILVSMFCILIKWSPSKSP